MKRFLTKTGLWILGGIATVVLIMSLLSVFSSGATMLTNALGVVAAPFRAAGASVADWFANTAQHFENVAHLQEENEELRRQVSDLERQLRQAQSQQQENAELRHLLGLQGQRSDFRYVDGRVTEKPLSNWQSVLTIDCGSRDGIALQQCAVDAYGNFVGVVSEVGYNWCRVTTLLDSDSAVGAKLFRTGEVAVAQGELSLLEKGQLRLVYLPEDAAPVIGEQVVTSGLGGYFPSGLVIGSVAAIRTDHDGLSRYAEVTAASDIDHLKELFFITDFTEETTEEE